MSAINTATTGYAELAGLHGANELCWFAAQVRSRHEKKVALQLNNSEVECFLPLYEAKHRWQDRNKIVSLPLFPGYVFTRIRLRERMQVVKTSGVVNLVAVHGQPCPIADQEIESLRRFVYRDGKLQPYPYLTVGRKVRVCTGPFAQVEGILTRSKGASRLIISIHLIERSVAVEIDAHDVVPI
ncbi:MAG: UpxY family transcription antiterminator [Terriglobales bacterium]